MKKLIVTAIAFALLATTSALAQTSRTRTQAPVATQRPNYSTGYEAYASVPGSNGQPGVYAFGRYLGWDPDPNIRFQLRRDIPDAD